LSRRYRIYRSDLEFVKPTFIETSKFVSPDFYSCELIVNLLIVFRIGYCSRLDSPTLKLCFVEGLDTMKKYSEEAIPDSLQKSQVISETDSTSDSCSTCLYTGVATCAAVSLYSLNAALDLPSLDQKGLSKEAIKTIKQQKRFLLGFAGAWTLAGCYRYYLG